MLDQSFSAHNLEVIFDLENRKGNIDIDWMPEGYRDAAAEMKELRRQISELKSKGHKKTEEDITRINELEKAYKQEKEKKEVNRQAFLKDCEERINSKDFRFTMTKYLDEDCDKEVFTLNADDPSVFFALKQLQYNIHKTFKVKQANRHAILCDVKALLHTKMPLHIVRTDISSFYESIPQTALLEKVEGNTLLSHKSKAFIRAILKLYDDCKDETMVAKGVGVPRGVGISPLLSEIYVRNLDSTIKSYIGTQFYARYVDDIFIILTSLPDGKKDAKDYFGELQALFGKSGLTLKDETYYSTYYADWKHEEVNSINTYDCDGEVVNEISLVFLRNSFRFYAAELKEYACKQEGKEYDVLKDRSLFLFQFDIDNYRNDLKRYAREGEDISGLPYVDKLFDKKYWEGKEGYQKKLEFFEETYRDLKEKGYTFEDFMNNLRSRMGG